MYVDTRSEARSSVCPLAPPKTIVNRFSGLVPRLDLDPVFGDEVRQVFLTHLPANERLTAPATERMLGSTVRNSTLLRAVKPNNSFMRPATIKLEPLKGTDALVSADHTVAALVTSRPDTDRLGACLHTRFPSPPSFLNHIHISFSACSASDTIVRFSAHSWQHAEYAPRISLKYGNAFSLDHRQKRIYALVQELLSEANYSDFSSHASTSIAKKAAQVHDLSLG